MNTSEYFGRLSISSLILASFVAYGCVNHELLPLAGCDENPLTLHVFDKIDNASCLHADGSFSVRVSNAIGNPTILINGQKAVTDGRASGLFSGEYFLQAFDLRGCADTLTVNIVNSNEDLRVEVIMTENNECSDNNGTATFMPSGGIAPYELYFRQTILEGNTVEGLRHGVYAIRVKDAADCLIEQSFTIAHGNFGISWNNDIKPVITTYCCKSGCHLESTGRVDFTKFSNVKLYAAAIKSRTESKSMPFDGPLEERYIQLIACWVDDGALEN